MSNNYRDMQGKYTKRSWTKRFILAVIFIAILTLGYKPIKGIIHNIRVVNNYQAPAPVKSAEEIKADAISERMKEVKTRTDHKAKVAKFDETEARRTATVEYEKDEATKYAAVQKDIQASKDIVKKDEVSF